MSDLEPSEFYGELRNDGLSVHHRWVFEKECDAIAEKIAELKAEILELGKQAVTDAEQRPGFQSRYLQIGGA